MLVSTSPSMPLASDRSFWIPASYFVDCSSWRKQQTNRRKEILQQFRAAGGGHVACKAVVRLAATILFAVAMAFPAHGEAKTEFDRWVEGRGALIEGEAKVRAESLLRSLHPCLQSTSLRVHVLDSQDVGAFAWPQGDIVLTRALLALLDDDELSAALAHEVGHLLANGHLNSAAALIGKPSHHESEAVADEMGMRLLVDGGGHASAMLRMLVKVQAAQTPGGVASQALARRITLLSVEP